MKLTIFYDGQCPLCLAEMRQLQANDQAGLIQFEDLGACDFSQRYPHIDPVRADGILHGQLESGELLLGLDVTCKAWSLVGKHKWLTILRWPLIRWVADHAYLVFARYRRAISYLLMRQPRCPSCMLENPNVDAHPQRSSSR